MAFYACKEVRNRLFLIPTIFISGRKNLQRLFFSEPASTEKVTVIAGDITLTNTSTSYRRSHGFSSWAKTACVAACLSNSFSVLAEETPPVKSLFEMRRENVVVQQWDLSCGAAALTTLLNYQHNDFVTEKEVANALMSRPEYVKYPGLVTVRQGFSLLDLKSYADARGYKGIGYGQLTFDDLLQKAPIIVPINVLGYNHFVIFRGMQGNRVLLADPAWGNRTMLVDAFEDSRIDFPKIGKVGFVITRLDGVEPSDRLRQHDRDFVMTR